LYLPEPANEVAERGLVADLNKPAQQPAIVGVVRGVATESSPVEAVDGSEQGGAA
jgi:hypothetical protein